MPINKDPNKDLRGMLHTFVYIDFASQPAFHPHDTEGKKDE
jgi:hypothetical protein